MKVTIISLSLFFFGLAATAQSPICADKKTDIKCAQDILKATQSLQEVDTACESPDQQAKSKKEFVGLVKAESKGEKVILIRDNPDKRTSNSATYKFNAQPLAPGESVYLWVPSDLAKRGLDFVVLGHRQNPATQTGTEGGDGKWDKKPGLTAITVYDKNRKPEERWRYWDGSASGKNGAKFAEVNEAFELEGLYQWSKLGHNGVKTNDTKHDELKPTMVKITSVGDDTVELSELTFKTNMAESDSSKEVVFTPGTKFGDQKSGEGYDLEGGQKNNGIFPEALPLKRYSKPNFDTSKLPPGWSLDKGSLIIPLEKGKILTNIEIAGGDAHTDGITNSDGGRGTKGWSRLSVFQKNGANTDTLMDRENVPPEGFLKAAPTKCGRPISEGETLVIQADSDITYIAGIKLNYKKP